MMFLRNLTKRQILIVGVIVLTLSTVLCASASADRRRIPAPPCSWFFHFIGWC
jgi:hypothetical protein